MQDEYGLTLKEGEADMYKHSTNRDVRYAERELHFVIPSTVQGITHLAIFFSSSMQKDANRPLIPPQTLALRLILPVNIRYQELSYHSISHSQK
ncbi:Uncharacterised protein [Klebsiella pneumoniae]|nr:Uncharacterised protein [Klebsiella pneumoniae]